MADELPEVQPGQRITAEAWNAVVRRLNAAVGASGAVPVPNLFGKTLQEALTTLNSAGSRLGVGKIFDVFGKSIIDTDATMRAQIVLGQTPPSGAFVSAGSGVSLVIAAKAAPGTGPTSETPAIASYEPDPVPLDTILHIRGEHFTFPPSSNIVTIGGVRASEPDNRSDATNLYVLVPREIPGGPGAGEAAKELDLVIVTGSLAQVAGKVWVAPPSATPTPIIDGFVPSQRVDLEQNLIINGGGFGSDVGAVRVVFDPTEAPREAKPTSVVPTSISVTVPKDITGLTASRDQRPIHVVVHVNDVASPAKTIRIRKP
ncbi:PASTA domain-containing protein [Sorangium sp. So ce1151]|uniref:PASTA domain-containing protein n=1 Tax=Sorangium sp. So ce1151 TaxID=3133332 RepID=UPI003F5E3100